jgi:oligopeptide/dipeptide ABC transporter ATP-binding protein
MRMIFQDPYSSLNPRMNVRTIIAEPLLVNRIVTEKKELGLTYLFVAHNLAVVEHVSDRVAVVYLGRIMELCVTREIFEAPLHPYTEALLSAVPVPDPDFRKDRILLEGEVPNLMKPPSGCHFQPRCRYADARCAAEIPELRELRAGHTVACHHAEKLTLRGIKRK